MKIAHSADLHLCAEPGEDRERRLEVLREICAIARGCDALVLAGDLFHRARDGEDKALREEVRSALGALAPAPVLAIPGNHDMLGAAGGHPLDGRYSFGDHVRLLLGRPFERVDAGGVSFFGFPFEAGAVTQTLFKGLPRPDGRPRVAILHGTAADRKGLAMYAYDDESREEGGDLLIRDRDLDEARVCYAALGHIHKAERWTLPGGGEAAYPGSPDMVTVKEEEARGINLVEIGEGGAVRAERRELASAVRARRRAFWLSPGREREAIAEARAFIRGEGPKVRPVAYLRGLGLARAAEEMAGALEREFQGRSPRPVIKKRFKGLGEGRDQGLFLHGFLDRMARASAAASGEREAEIASRASLLGWAALSEGEELDRIFERAGGGTR
jgi:hypothetical protein